MQGHDRSVTTLHFSPDESHIVSGSSDRTVRVWDLNTGIQVHTLSGHLEAVYSVVYSLDGVHIASASEDQTVRIWDSFSGEQIHHFIESTCPTSISFSPDGIHLTTRYEDDSVSLRHVLSGRELCTLPSFPSVEFLATQQGDSFLSTSDDISTSSSTLSTTSSSSSDSTLYEGKKPQGQYSAKRVASQKFNMLPAGLSDSCLDSPRDVLFECTS
jgi:WD40 repeat protein